MARDCKHGSLARSCEICELETDLARLRSAAEVLIPWAEEGVLVSCAPADAHATVEAAISEIRG